MREGVGGIVNIWTIAVFIVIISGLLAFSVQYNKAFRMKNEIIKALEQCDGNLECADPIIEEYKNKIGYNIGQNWKWTDGSDCQYKDGYYICEHEVSGSESGEFGKRVYYTVATVVNTDIPIFRNIIPNMEVFQVSGNTKRITLH